MELFAVWFENGRSKKIQYDIDEVRYKFEFSDYGTTKVAVPNAREYEEHYNDFDAEGSYDYYTKDGSQWQKETSHYDDDNCE